MPSRTGGVSLFGRSGDFPWPVMHAKLKGMEEVDREIFEDDKRNGEWVEGSARREAERYAETQRRVLQKIDQTHQYSIGIRSVSRHTWAAIIWRR